MPDVADGPRLADGSMRSAAGFAGFGDCMNAPEDKDGFQDSDGCADPDNDRDGIADVADGHVVGGVMSKDKAYPAYGDCMRTRPR